MLDREAATFETQRERNRASVWGSGDSPRDHKADTGRKGSGHSKRSTATQTSDEQRSGAYLPLEKGKPGSPITAEGIPISAEASF